MGGPPQDVLPGVILDSSGRSARWEPPIANLEGSGEWDRAATRTESLIVCLVVVVVVRVVRRPPFRRSSLADQPFSVPKRFTRGELLTHEHCYLLLFYKATLFTTPLLVHVKLLWDISAHAALPVSTSIWTDCYDRNLGIVNRCCQTFYPQKTRRHPGFRRKSFPSMVGLLVIYVGNSMTFTC